VQIQESVSVAVRRGAESWQFFAFVFAAVYALFITLFDECKQGWLNHWGVRVATKCLVFAVLFFLIMKSAWFHNALIRLLDWLVTEQHGQP
jgi:hypothetical protein